MADEIGHDVMDGWMEIAIKSFAKITITSAW